MSRSLFSVTPEPLTGGGIFSVLQSLDPPWATEDIALQLDIAYYGNVSGGKGVSPLIDRLLTASKLTTLDMATLAGVLMATNKERWAREWATRSAEYDPIENYRMTEEMTDDETVTEYGRTHTRTDNLAHTETRTDNLTRTIDNQEITTPNLTSTSQQATRGFNSSSDVNTDKETATSTGTNRVDTDGTEHNTGTQGTTGSNTGTQTDADTGTDTSTRNYTLTRSGNIGVTTSQQMLQSERDLWMWSYFYDVVFPDVDELLTVPLYTEYEESEQQGIIPTGTKIITSNGEYNVYSFANADVNVPNTYTVSDEGKVVSGGALVNQSGIDICANGSYDTTVKNLAIVNVPNSYTLSDEGKVVSNGALVAQSDLTITENGEYDTTLVKSVNINVAGAVSIYDFTKTLVDPVKGFTATLNNCDRDSNGVLLDAANSSISIPNTQYMGAAIDVYTGDIIKKWDSGNHARFIMYATSYGLIYRNNGKWSFYAAGGWSTDSDIADPDYFSNCKVTVYIDTGWYWKIYKNDVLVYEPNISVGSNYVYNNFIFGSSSQSVYDVVIKKVVIH